MAVGAFSMLVFLLVMACAVGGVIVLLIAAFRPRPGGPGSGWSRSDFTNSSSYSNDPYSQTGLYPDQTDLSSPSPTVEIHHGGGHSYGSSDTSSWTGGESSVSGSWDGGSSSDSGSSFDSSSGDSGSSVSSSD